MFYGLFSSRVLRFNVLKFLPACFYFQKMLSKAKYELCKKISNGVIWTL